MDWCALRRQEGALARPRTTIAVLAVVVAAALGFVLLRPGVFATKAGSRGSDAADGAASADSTAGAAGVAVRDPLPVPTEVLKKLETLAPEQLSPEDRAAYDEYVSKAEATVRNNADDLKTVLSRYLAALQANDASALGSLCVSDEGYTAEELAARLLNAQKMAIVGGEPLGSVQIRPYRGATVYVCFALVVGRYGNIDTRFTMPLPLRRTTEGWRATSFDPLNDPNDGQVIVSQIDGIW